VKRFSGFVAMTMAVAASILAISPTPAHAAAGWQTYTLNPSTWTCLPAHEWLSNVFQRSCVISNANADVQAVVIVSNYRGSSIHVDGEVELVEDDHSIGGVLWYSHECTTNETILSGTSRACFGPSWRLPCRLFYANGFVKYNFTGNWYETESGVRFTDPC
jgi:hypothetical protein